ncbi:deoxyribose-phosphate aldolase [Sodalis sp. dw_96]|uniref:deoxyribose-phosphate aldolase n=1 Tax=Sodalis sp. dw_96 TaxID=2719794 RepID=UPI001BD2E74A|nr:deoxyribose-phosphate aldolase [Sodalis sp. dw_96]
MNLTLKELAGLFDHTNLRADATRGDFQKLCDEAREYGFASVAVNSYPVAMCREMLKGSGVLTGAAIGFPLGQTTVEAKVFEAQNAIDRGAQEFDYLLNVGKVKEHDYGYIEREMEALVGVARKGNIICKVIFETCYLTENEIIEAAKIAGLVKPDFVKTSTGFGIAGATPEHVTLMKKHAGREVQVKAAGGIRSYQDAKIMIEAGATRLGSSSGIKIIEEMRHILGE